MVLSQDRLHPTIRGVGKLLLWFAAAQGAIWRPSASAQTFNPQNPEASGYVMTFSDDFKSIKSSAWEDNWWYKIQKTPDCQKEFLPSTIIPSPDGLHLHIRSLEALPACQMATKYSNAHLDTYIGFSQQYGYFEAKIKSSAEKGTLTAFWLMPESGSWPPEVDIEEIRGDIPNTAYMTNHTGRDNKGEQFLFNSPKSLSNSYHTYGVLLTPQIISWFVDGVRQGQTRQGSDEATPMFVVFSLDAGVCGDGWAGCPDKETNWSADAFVEWVHVWGLVPGH